MGMSTWVVGLRTDQNLEYQKQVRVVEACRDANIEKLPPETARYFDQDYHPADVDVESALQVKIPVKEWSDGDMQEGYEVNVADIPSGVVKIRFVNSW